MFLYFEPQLNGQDYDVVGNGGFVDVIEFYNSPNLLVDGSLKGRVEGSTPVGNQTFRFEFPDTLLPDGRYWTRVGWRTDAFADVTWQNFVTVDFPAGATKPVAVPEDLTVLLNLSFPIADDVRSQLQESLFDAQAVVELAIGSIIPKQLLLQNAYYDEAAQLDKMLPSTWFYDITNIQIESWLNNPDGTYNVTYWFGFDGRTETPIKRFILRYAAAWWRKAFQSDSTFGQEIASMATEGQSVSYVKNSLTDIDPSLGMSLDALVKRYGSAEISGRVAVFQRRNQWYGPDRTYWSGDSYDPDVSTWWW